MTDRVSGKTRGHVQDAAEKWLSENDPQYARSKRAWTSPSTDALPRALHASNEPHPTLEDLDRASSNDHGAYRRRRHQFSDGEDVPFADVNVDNVAAQDEDNRDE